MVMRVVGLLVFQQQIYTIDRTILPADGVYVTDVVIDGKRYRSMTSLGKMSLLVVQSYVLKPISLILKVIYMEKQSKSSG